MTCPPPSSRAPPRRGWLAETSSLERALPSRSMSTDAHPRPQQDLVAEGDPRRRARELPNTRPVKTATRTRPTRDSTVTSHRAGGVRCHDPVADGGDGLHAEEEPVQDSSPGEIRDGVGSTRGVAGGEGQVDAEIDRGKEAKQQPPASCDEPVIQVLQQRAGDPLGRHVKLAGRLDPHAAELIKWRRGATENREDTGRARREA